MFLTQPGLMGRLSHSGIDLGCKGKCLNICSSCTVSVRYINTGLLNMIINLLPVMTTEQQYVVSGFGGEFAKKCKTFQINWLVYIEVEHWKITLFHWLWIYLTNFCMYFIYVCMYLFIYLLFNMGRPFNETLFFKGAHSKPIDKGVCYAGNTRVNPYSSTISVLCSFTRGHYKLNVLSGRSNYEPTFWQHQSPVQ